MAKTIKTENTNQGSNLLHGKFELPGIDDGRYSVGGRIIVTTDLDEETCNYLVSIEWPHISIVQTE